MADEIRKSDVDSLGESVGDLNRNIQQLSESWGDYVRRMEASNPALQRHEQAYRSVERAIDSMRKSTEGLTAASVDSTDALSALEKAQGRQMTSSVSLIKSEKDLREEFRARMRATKGAMSSQAEFNAVQDQSLRSFDALSVSLERANEAANDYAVTETRLQQSMRRYAELASGSMREKLQARQFLEKLSEQERQYIAVMREGGGSLMERVHQLDMVKRAVAEYGHESSQVQALLAAQSPLNRDLMVAELERIRSTSTLKNSLSDLFGTLLVGNNVEEDRLKLLDEARAAQNNTAVIVERLSRRYKEWEQAHPRLGRNMRRFGTVVTSVTGYLRIMASTLTSVLRISGNLATSLIAFPFQVARGFARVGQELSNITKELREGIEEIRGEFGSLNEDIGRTIELGIIQFERGESVLRAAGLDTVAMFGRWEEADRNRQRAAMEMIQSMGRLATRFSEDIRQNVVQLTVYQRGLGLTAEAMQAFAIQADASGRASTDALRELNEEVQFAAQRFGVSSRAISSDVGQMRSDFRNFGAFTTRELVGMSTQARRLGIEISDLTGLIGQFDDFEGAANAAAMLAQAFGMNVDAMDLMMAQDPTERLDILRRSFTATGRSINEMTRAERQLLEQQTGLSQQALELAFSQEGMAMGYDEITSALAEVDPIERQANAMERLGDNIQQMIRPINQFTSAIQAFFHGFTRGIRATQIGDFFERLVETIGNFAHLGERIGRRLGQDDGLIGFFNRLEPLLDINRWDKAFGSIVSGFSEFLVSVGEGDRAGLANFLSGTVRSIAGVFEPVLQDEKIREKLRNFAGTMFGQVSEAFHRFVTAPDSLFHRALDGLVASIGTWWDNRGREHTMPIVRRIALSIAGLFAAKAIAGAVIGRIGASLGGWLLGGSAAATGSATAAGAAMTNATATAAAGAATRGPAVSMMARAGAGLKAAFTSAFLAKGAALLAAGAVGAAIGTFIDRAILQPHREGNRLFREQISQLNEESLQELLESEETGFFRRRQIRREMARREADDIASGAWLEPLRAAQEADRAHLTRISGSDGQILEEFRERRLEFERRRQELMLERPQEEIRRGLFGITRVVGPDPVEERAWQERMRQLEGNFSDVAGQIERGRQAIEASAGQLGGAMSQGVAGGIERGSQDISSAALAGTQNALAMVQQDFQIRSPSERTAREIGAPFAEGIVQGILSRAGMIAEAAQGLGQRLSGGLQGAMSAGIGVALGAFSAEDTEQTIQGRYADVFERAGVEIQGMFVDSAADTLETNLRHMQREFARLDEGLSRGIPRISMSGTLKKFGEAVNVARETIQLRQPNITLNLELNVSLDADELAWALSDPSRSTPLVTFDDFD